MNKKNHLLKYKWILRENYITLAKISISHFKVQEMVKSCPKVRRSAQISRKGGRKQREGVEALMVSGEEGIGWQWGGGGGGEGG